MKNSTNGVLFTFDEKTGYQVENRTYCHLLYYFIFRRLNTILKVGIFNNLKGIFNNIT